MNTLKEALDQLEKAKEMLSKAIEEILNPASILDGKVAIQVNNEREFKLLMEHYESKGWRWKDGRKPFEYYFDKHEPVIIYGDEFGTSYINGYAKGNGYKIMPFSDFASETGIKMPVFIMKSEDGVDLYDGDIVYCIYLDRSNKLRWKHIAENIIKKGIDFVFMQPNRKNESKGFSTREAAEKWIEEHNKLKVIRFDFDGGHSVVTKDKIRVHLDCEGVKGYFMESSEIEPIYKAYKSLQ